MGRILLFSLILASTSIFAANDHVYITVGSDSVQSYNKSIMDYTELESSSGISVVKIRKDDIENLSHLMHQKFNRCGGFIVHENKEEAISVLKDTNTRKFAKSLPFMDYTINQQDKVKDFVSQVTEFSIRETITKMSSFQNRYYKSQTGVDSQKWLKNKWSQIVEGRSDVKVEFYNHKNWPQPSVMLTVKGSERPDEIVVIGGHADSIAGWWRRAKARAPGADDNASGIATITEVIRVMAENSYSPKRTVVFMAYAAEEVGLLGSKEIASTFKKEKKNVVGVLQLDMTNHKGTGDLDIVFMTDYTNAEQNKFLSQLVDTYVKVPWGNSKCGYGCSDHASWHNAGFPASIPFESTMEDINSKIHTDKDTISQSGSTADHAEKFAKLAVAYLVEMAK